MCFLLHICGHYKYLIYMNNNSLPNKFSIFQLKNTQKKVVIYVDDADFFIRLRTAFGYLHDHFDQVYVSIENTIPASVITKDEVQIHIGNRSLLSPTLIISNKMQQDNIPHLSYQRHLFDLKTMPVDIKHSWCSLGELRNKGHVVEPLLRPNATISFFADSLRGADCGWVRGCQPSGLSSEEACQIFQGLGTANDIQYLFMEIPSQADDIIAALYAEMIWYFIEGRQQFIQDHPSAQPYQEYMVSLEDIDAIFVQNELTGRWWLCTDVDNKLAYIPCSEQEYREAALGSLCDRLRYFSNLA